MTKFVSYVPDEAIEMCQRRSKNASAGRSKNASGVAVGGLHR